MTNENEKVKQSAVAAGCVQWVKALTVGGKALTFSGQR
jgi:hypothetical protein